MNFLDIFKNNLQEKVDLLGTKTAEYNPKLIKKGEKVEKEHTDNPKQAQKIAKQHTAEFPKLKNDKIDSDYYEELDKMEKKLDKKKTKSFKEIVSELDQEEVHENTVAGGVSSAFGPSVVGTADQFSSDSYAKGDARIPKIIGAKPSKKKKKVKFPIIRRTFVKESKDYNQYVINTPQNGGQYYSLNIPVGINPPSKGDHLILQNKNVVVWSLSTPEDMEKGRGGPVATSMRKNNIAYAVNCLPVGHEYLKNNKTVTESLNKPKQVYIITKDGYYIKDFPDELSFRGYAIERAYSSKQAAANYIRRLKKQNMYQYGKYDAIELTYELKSKIDVEIARRKAPKIIPPEPKQNTPTQLNLDI